MRDFKLKMAKVFFLSVMVCSIPSVVFAADAQDRDEDLDKWAAEALTFEMARQACMKAKQGNGAFAP